MKKQFLFLFALLLFFITACNKATYSPEKAATGNYYDWSNWGFENRKIWILDNKTYESTIISDEEIYQLRVLQEQNYETVTIECIDDVTVLVSKAEASNDAMYYLFSLDSYPNRKYIVPAFSDQGIIEIQRPLAFCIENTVCKK